MKLDYPHGHDLSTPRLNLSPLRYYGGAKVLLVFLLLLLILLVITPWQQTARGRGRVVAFSASDRQQNIEAPIFGRLGTWYVQEGSHVDKGDPIVQILDNDPEILTRIAFEREAIFKKLEALRKASETSLLNVARQKSLFEQGISSRRDFELAELEYAKFIADEAKASAELTNIDIKLARQSNQTVTAPTAGIIQRRLTGAESRIVKDGDLLAVIVPETDSRAVEIWVAGNDMPLIHAGDKVRLQFEGWPAIQFSGWPSVAVGTFGGVVSFVDPSDNGYGEFRLLVEPDQADIPWPSSHYLRQGVRSIGWVLLKQVPLGYEIWRQFNGFPPSVSPKAIETFSDKGKSS